MVILNGAGATDDIHSMSIPHFLVRIVHLRLRIFMARRPSTLLFASPGGKKPMGRRAMEGT